MERYELVERGSSKFWEVEAEGATLLVRFGRIGTAGQEKAKTFSTPDAAEEEKAKLVRDKVGKGYVPVGLADEGAPPELRSDAPTAVPSGANQPVGHVAGTAGARADGTAQDGTAAGAGPVAVGPAEAGAAAAFVEEEGVGKLFQAEPLPTRTRPGPASSPAEAWAGLLDALRAAAAQPPETVPEAIPPLLARFEAGPPAAMGVEEAASVLADLAAGRREGGLEPYAWELEADGGKRRFLRQDAYSAALDGFLRWLLPVGGALVAVQAVGAHAPSRAAAEAAWDRNLAVALRRAVVHAPEEQYDQAAEWAEHTASSGGSPVWERLGYWAFAFGDDRPEPRPLQPVEVLRAAPPQTGDYDHRVWPLPLILESRPSGAEGLRRRNWLYTGSVVSYAGSADCAAATAIATARRHGEEAAPVLAWVLRACRGYERRPDRAKQKVLSTLALAMLETREEGVLALLLPFLPEAPVRAALDRAAEAYPAWTFGQCLAVLATAGQDAPALDAKVRDMVRSSDTGTVLAWAAGLPQPARELLDGFLEAVAAPSLPPDRWPEVLRDPPWREPRRSAARPVVRLKAIPTPFAYRPEPAQAAADPAAPRAPLVLRGMAELAPAITAAERAATDEGPGADLPPADLSPERALDWLCERLSRPGTWSNDAFRQPYHERYAPLLQGLAQQPEPLALRLWALPAVATWLEAAATRRIVAGMLDRFGEAALPGLLAWAPKSSAALDAALGVDAPQLVAPFLERAWIDDRLLEWPAGQWVRRHRRTVVARLLPDAVGRLGPKRAAAEGVLRWLAAERPDGADEVRRVAREYAAQDPRAEEAVEKVLALGPLDMVPAKEPKLPAWLAVPALSPPRVRLPEGGEGAPLPDAAMHGLLEMLSFCAPGAVYAGVGQVREACTPESLRAFVWDLYCAWTKGRSPPGDAWAMRAMGWLGDDGTARHLAGLIRRWSGSLHSTGVVGLDVLADIGTDAALAGLGEIAEKANAVKLREVARARLAAAAEARGLTADELADLLIPDLDLDERGGLDLEFGPRRFRAGFDEQLRPWVRDAATGVRLKELPKPNKSDDADKSAEAVARWSALKKDARAVAAVQLARLEAMLARARRVAPEVFWRYFAAHPLLRHPSARLVWGVYPDRAPTTRPSATFRVTEELGLTGAGDEPFRLDTGAPGLVGLLHPLQAEAALLQAWGALFGEYEITQPFPQLGRETHTLDERERAGTELTRLAGARVEGVRLRGLASRGWELGRTEAGGAIRSLEYATATADGKPVGAELAFEEGLSVTGARWEDGTQTLSAIRLGERPTRGTGFVRAMRFGELDPIAASEMLRGVMPLAGLGKA